MVVPRREGAVDLVLLENDLARAVVAPGIGGRVVSLVHRPSGREFLWRNSGLELERCAPGSEYDPNFYGGMDELLPCDIPETIDGIEYPDHGELWTLPLDREITGERLLMAGRLPRSGLTYSRTVMLEGNRLVSDYSIGNPNDEARVFLWKLHGALAVRPGDRVVCPAATARVADPQWSRRRSTEPFAWPFADGVDFSLVPPADGATDFLYLSDLSEGRMALHATDGARIECDFDLAVFPCAWYFASHGGLDGAVTAILEPCTTMPISVNEAAGGDVCARLEPGDRIETTVSWSVDAAVGGPS